LCRPARGPKELVIEPPEPLVSTPHDSRESDGRERTTEKGYRTERASPEGIKEGAKGKNGPEREEKRNGIGRGQMGGTEIGPLTKSWICHWANQLDTCRSK